MSLGIYWVGFLKPTEDFHQQRRCLELFGSQGRIFGIGHGDGRVATSIGVERQVKGSKIWVVLSENGASCHGFTSCTYVDKFTELR